MSRTVDMLALTLLVSCRVHAPAKPCADVMLGACVDRPVALPTCERGRARNLDDSSCATSRETRDLARTAGVYVDDNDFIECEAKSDELVASARLGKIGCIAREAPPLPCPVRTVRTGAVCSPLDRGGGALDLAVFTRAGAADACARLLRSPLVLASPETVLEVELQATVPNNDLTRGFVRLRTKPAVPDADAARRVGALIDDAMRRLGGTASASEASAAETCAASARRPISVP